MKHAHTARLLAIALLAVSTLPLAAERPRVDTVDSARVAFGLVQAETETSGVHVHGTLAQRIPHRGAVPGAIRVQVLDAQGQVLAERDVAPMRRNRQALSAHFNTHLEVAPPSDGSVRVIHLAGSAPLG
ncbi:MULTISPECIES: hypothetical protein [Marichromatium]|uniref:Uncharacterized protein n=1 Tax=Marichromatium gracile TaxID=1048 RepID=A0A4R4ALA6_MARGR|nr:MULTISPECIES: hypothetical protein [Marichromatium]MBO8087115.1 hypothetical protein [Marichromatium sp.]MBK1707593.1 hypothetical protein [Marichromatium gracile]RNE90900.1 hypothetical protein EBL85_14515 [Marichromatium sp. AB32]RNE91931.1 hypothetical protein EBL84_00450 [Marichromatium sp. AB31]TCW39944.1 hypothetical protein EDC29_101360 [Marichromatium gracile]